MSTTTAAPARRRPRLDWRAIAESVLTETAVQVLELAAKRDEISAKDAAEELELPIANVSYHVRRLAALGFLEATRQEPRRGAIQHYYRLARQEAQR